MENSNEHKLSKESRKKLEQFNEWMNAQLKDGISFGLLKQKCLEEGLTIKLEYGKYGYFTQILLDGYGWNIKAGNSFEPAVKEFDEQKKKYGEEKKESEVKEGSENESTTNDDELVKGFGKLKIKRKILWSFCGTSNKAKGQIFCTKFPNHIVFKSFNTKDGQNEYTRFYVKKGWIEVISEVGDLIYETNPNDDVALI